MEFSQLTNLVVNAYTFLGMWVNNKNYFEEGQSMKEARIIKDLFEGKCPQSEAEAGKILAALCTKPENGLDKTAYELYTKCIERLYKS